MKKKNNPKIEEYGETTEENLTRTNFFVAIGMLVAAAVCFGCTFIPGAGVFLLIASVLLELAALSFLSTQKKKNNFKAVFYVTIAAYVLLAISGLTFIGGLVYVIVTG